jgi:hypothetical protein
MDKDPVDAVQKYIEANKDAISQISFGGGQYKYMKKKKTTRRRKMIRQCNNKSLQTNDISGRTLSISIISQLFVRLFLFSFYSSCF